jgi:zinc protease
MTLPEHTTLAQKYLRPDQLVFVIVGDKETQFDDLKQLGLGEPILLDKDARQVVKQASIPKWQITGILKNDIGRS